MLEVWIQWSCDGCEETTEFHHAPDATKREIRAMLAEGGWKSYGRLDYCPDCVKLGNHKKRTSLYQSGKGIRVLTATDQD